MAAFASTVRAVCDIVPMFVYCCFDVFGDALNGQGDFRCGIEGFVRTPKGFESDAEVL
jgi:hypothetical protein